MAPIVYNGGGVSGQYKIKHHKSQSAMNFQSHFPVQLSKDDHQQGPSTCTALPRLSQALKSLRMSSFLNSSGNAKSKPAFVDADDVIYYSNKEENNSNDRHKKNLKSNGHARLTAAASLTNFSRDSCGADSDYQALPSKGKHQEYNETKEKEVRVLPANDVYRHNKALAEIRQLYKSTPNFSLLEDELCDESYEGQEEPTFSVSRHSTGREVDSLGMSSSSTTHYPFERPIMGTRISEQHFLQLNNKKNRLKRKMNSSISSTATSSTTSSTAQSGNLMEISSPTDSGYLSRRQTPRHVTGVMSSSTKSLTNAVDGGKNGLLSEEITERTVDVTQETINLPRELHKRITSSKKSIPTTNFRKYCWAEHTQSSSFNLTKLPFDCKDVLKLIEQHLADFEDSSAIASELTNLMKGIFHQICEEICRLSSHLLKCSSNDICTAVRLILPDTMACNCINAGIQAISLYGLGGSGALLRVSMSIRAGLRLDVGKFYRFMVDSKLATVVTDSAVIFLTAAVECALIEAVKFVKSKGSKVSCSYLLKSLKKCFNRLNEEDEHLPVCAKSIEELKEITVKLQKQLNDQSVKAEICCEPLHYESSALLAFFYFVKCKGEGACICVLTKEDLHENHPSLRLWLNITLLFVHHRTGSVVMENDVFQAARILLPTFECPPCTTTQLLDEFDINLGFNQFSKSILTANEDEIEIFMLNGSKILDSPVQALNTRAEKKTTMDHLINPLFDFDGWTPLTWAVALENTALVIELLHSDFAHVQDPFMIRESPLQIAAIVNNNELCQGLISAGANPFHSSMNYESMKTNFRVFGAPSALALAAVYNHTTLFEEMLATRVTNGCHSGLKISMEEFFCENTKKQLPLEETQPDLIQRNQTIYTSLNRFQRRSMSEALYYAVETLNLSMTIRLRDMGVPWSGYCWLRSLQTACQDSITNTTKALLDDFDQRFMDDITKHENADTFSQLLFTLLPFEDFECCIAAAKILSHQFKLSRANSSSSLSSDLSKCLPSSQDVRPLIDPKFVDNPELSDIRFKVQGRIVHAHRIVLINASDKFRNLLKNPNGIVEVEDISYSVFKTILEYLYSNSSHASVEQICQNKDIAYKLQLICAARAYGLNHLCEEYQKLVKATINTANCFQIYSFANKHNFCSLANECEFFLLSNLPSIVRNNDFLANLKCQKLKHSLVNRFVKALNQTSGLIKFVI